MMSSSTSSQHVHLLPMPAPVSVDYYVKVNKHANDDDNNSNNSSNNNNRNISISDENDEGEFDDYDDDGSFEILVQTYMRDQSYTSTNRAALNIVYSMLNAGIVALPYAAAQAGLPLFFFLLAVSAIISGYTNCVVINMANEQKVRTLEDLGERAFGRKGFYLICFVQIIYSISLMCMTLDVCADIITSILNQNLSQPLATSSVFDTKIHRRVISVIFGGLLMFPLCTFAKSLSSLWWSSYVSVATILTALLTAVVTYIMEPHSNTPSGGGSYVKVVELNSLWWAAPFIVAFVFSYNQKVFSVYSCLRQRSSTRWQMSLTRAHLLTVFLYLLFGAAGYLCHFGSGRVVNFNFFINVGGSSNNILSNILRCVVTLSLLLTLPVDCLVASSTWRRLWRRFQRYSRNKGSIRSESSSLRSDDRRVNVPGTIDKSTVDEGDRLTGTTESSDNSSFFKSLNLNSFSDVNDPAFALSSAINGTVDNNNTYNNNKQDDKADNSEDNLTENNLNINANDSNSNNNSSNNRKSRLSSQSLNSSNVVDIHNDIILRRSQDGPRTAALDDTDEDGWREGRNSYCTDSGVWRGNDERGNLSSRPAGGKETFLSRISPAIGMWIICVLICSVVETWQVLALTVASFATAALVFVVPSMLYFRLGLATDFSVIPLFGFIPNRIYMRATQALGIAGLLIGVGMLIYCQVMKIRIM